MALAALERLPETTEEIRACCADLKVLGRKEFKLLLKWRLKVREIFGFPTKKTTTTPLSEEVAEVESMDEELRIQEELQKIKDKESAKKKKERRKENEKKQKEIVRMQMNMTAPMDIGMEQEGPRGPESMFRLKSIDQTEALRRISKGKMAMLTEVEARKDRDSGIGSSGETDDETDEEGDRLERELDSMYDQYRERKAEADAKYRAKKARKEHDDEEWEGVSASEKGDSDDDDDEELDEDSDEDSDAEERGDTGKPLIRDLDDAPQDTNGLSKRARGFFNQDIFQSIPGLLHVPEDEESEDEEMAEEGEEGPELSAEESDGLLPVQEQKKKGKEKTASKDEENGDDFEVVKQNEDDDWEETEKKKKDGRPGKWKLISGTSHAAS